MLPTPSTAAQSRPQLANLLLSARKSLGIAINSVTSSDDAQSESHQRSLLRGTSKPIRDSDKTSLSTLVRDALPSPKTAAFVLSCLLWYFASALSSNTSKALLSSPKGIQPRPPAPFPYPVTLTLIQFVFIHLLSSAVASPRLMSYIPGVRKPVTRIVPSPGWQRISDMAKLSVFNVVGHALSTVAISRVPVSTVHTIKALTPLFTVLSFRYIFKVHYSFMAYFSLVPLTLGVMMACTSLSFSANDLVGLITALASTFIFVAQSIYSKNLVGRGGEKGKSKALVDGKDNGGKLDKINILYYTSACSIMIMIPMALYYDGAKMLLGRQAAAEAAAAAVLASGSGETTSLHPYGSTHYISMLVAANGVVQFFQNFLAFSVLSLVSPVTYSIASLFKRVFVICFAIVWFGQSVSALQWLGIVLTFIGLYIYNDAKASKSIASGEEKLAREEQRKSMTLPTTARGAAWLNGDASSSASSNREDFDLTTPRSSALNTTPGFNNVVQHQHNASSSALGGVSASRSTSVNRGFGDFSIGSAVPSSASSSAAAHAAARSPVSAHNDVASSLRHHHPASAASLTFMQDPRRSIPSPPPSRGPSSDDEGVVEKA